MNQWEFERKYLIRTIPIDLDQYPKEEIAQGYVVVAEDGTEVRVRRKELKFYLTIKSGGTGVRAEREIEINQNQFNELWPTTEGRRIEKVRYKIPYKNKTIELDVYRGSLKGLIVAEVEFLNENDYKNFKPPEWFEEEITERSEYKNQNLARYGLP